MILGRGLHGGALGAVHLACAPGPTVLRRGGEQARVAELHVVDTLRSTTVARLDGAVRLRTVEHLFAALAAVMAYESVVVEVDGPEVPLVDGGARAFVDALDALEIAPVAPPLQIARDGVVDVGASQYVFARGTAREVSVEIDFADARLEPCAAWRGDVEDFRTRIAGARTFGFEHEVADLLARGLASHVEPESVVLVCERGILSAGRPFERDEPARHKLLDLVGDLFVHGGPAFGRVHAVRPGHAATHAAVRRALEEGILVRDDAAARRR